MKSSLTYLTFCVFSLFLKQLHRFQNFFNIYIIFQKNVMQISNVVGGIVTAVGFEPTSASHKWA